MNRDLLIVHVLQTFLAIIFGVLLTILEVQGALLGLSYLVILGVVGYQLNEIYSQLQLYFLKKAIG